MKNFSLKSAAILIILLSLSYFAGTFNDSWFGGGPDYKVYDSTRTEIKWLPSFSDDEIVEVEIEVPAKVDTNKIIQDYYRKRTYNLDTATHNDVMISFTGEVFNNTLTAASFDVINTRPTEIYLPPIDNAISAKLFVTNDVLSPMLEYRHKKFQVAAGKNLIGSKDLTFMVGMTLIEW